MLKTQLLRQSYTAQYPTESNRNRYPVLVLQITLPPSSIDVNLTPDKTQVLLHNKVSTPCFCPATGNGTNYCWLL